MKLFCRLVVIIFCLHELIDLFLPPYSITIKEIKTFKDLTISILIVSMAVSGLICWFYMFWHWSTQQFVSKRIKILWFIVLFVGTIFYLIGPLVYYVFVIELKVGLKTEKSCKVT